MILLEWEIWHTYATYFVQHIKGLETVARFFISSGFAECVMLRDGKTFWRKSKSGYQEGVTVIDLTTDEKETRSHLNVLGEENLDIANYALEAWNIGAQLRLNEIRLFNVQNTLPPSYIRAFLGLCRLIKEDAIITFYPVLTLYETGILLVHFRVIGPDQPVGLEEFVDHHINLFQHYFDNVEVPPAVASLAPISYDLYTSTTWSPIARYRLMHDQTIHNTEVAKLINIDKTEDFLFELVFCSINYDTN